MASLPSSAPGTSASLGEPPDADVKAIERQLRRRISPRGHMFALICVSGACAFLASFLLLKAGLVSMALRYPLAVAAGYAVFLALIRLWLRRYRIHKRARERPDPDASGVDFVEVPVDAMFSNAPSMAPQPSFGGGGGFAGGGSSRSWGAGTQSSSSKSGGLGLDLDVGDDAWPLLVAGVVAAIALGAALYTLWIAPPLFAELLLDAAIAGGMYQRLRKRTDASWFRTAFRRTVVPAAFMMTLLGVSGWILQTAYPGAASIGRVWERVFSAP